MAKTDIIGNGQNEKNDKGSKNNRSKKIDENYKSRDMENQDL
jgi:hypothetical protein